MSAKQNNKEHLLAKLRSTMLEESEKFSLDSERVAAVCLKDVEEGFAEEEDLEGMLLTQQQQSITLLRFFCAEVKAS